ncbi:MAG TPA: MotA/TolQ/ExbB proton channel family protein [Longimicrobiales bacterium]|nr:MotA/TolQ/ExbB proton channel family protein [Longimicrobiales bacterium]
MVNILAQIGGAASRAAPSAFDLIAHGTAVTWIVLGTIALFSVTSWMIILWKLGQFRKVRRLGRRFSEAMRHAVRLEDAHSVLLRLPDSPHSRLFRSGLNFFGELRPGALKPNAPPSAGLSEGQLNALWLMLEKVQEEERDTLTHGLVWLSVVAVVSPLLGLLGTVIGVMDSFLGVTATGSANIGAVAPGIAEALVTTAFGLVAAIPAAIAYNFFVSRLNGFSGELEGFASEFIGALAREGRL